MALPEVCQHCGKLAYPGGTVTISAEEYQGLLHFKKQREAVYERASNVRLAHRMKIGRDPELAQFILRSAETMLIKEIEAACIERFGRERTPSQSSIHRFIHGRAEPR